MASPQELRSCRTVAKPSKFCNNQIYTEFVTNSSGNIKFVASNNSINVCLTVNFDSNKLIYLKNQDGDPSLITLPYGQIKGHVLRTLNGNYYNAFQEIPYAAPPVNRLRFKEPTAPGRWYGILETTKNTKICYQKAVSYAPTELVLSEDCLCLNVYAPANATDALPVLVWIHGGGYVSGDGTYQSYGPQYLIDYDIVVVTINYRLGPLGFLTTEDGVIPGNLGLKDQNFALKWVKENIKLFGGDPEKITIAGQSGGGSSVGLHLVSKNSRGLFRGAILESGTALSPFARQPFARALAFELGRSLDANFTSDDSTELLNLLQSISAADISSTGITFPWRVGVGILPWSPVIEDENFESAFLTSPMHEDIKNGNINQVPIIIGFNSEEYLTLLSSTSIALAGTPPLDQQGIVFDNDLSTLVDILFNMTDEDKYIAGSLLRKIYTNGTFGEDYGALVRYASDTMFTTPAIRHAELQSTYTDVYLYELSYNEVLSQLVFAGETINIEGVDPNGVGHGAEMFYLWGNSFLSDITTFPARDRVVQGYLLRLWTNFVKYLNPTPRQDTWLQNIIWSKVSPDNLNYLNINSTLSMQFDPKEYTKWKGIIDKYAIPPLFVY